MRISDGSSDVCSSDLLVRAYERRSLDDETSRRAVVEDARLCVEAAIGEPVGQHGNAKRGPIGIRPPAVAENAGHQALDHTGLARPLSRPPDRQPENQRHEPWMRPPMARRSEEPRAGYGSVSPWSSRWSPEH